MFYSFQTGHNGIWLHGRFDSWQNGFMAVWIHGTMDAWQFGYMALWMCGSLDAWYFQKHPPPPPAVVQNQNTLCTLTLIYSKSPKTKNSKTFWRLVILLQMF